MPAAARQQRVLRSPSWLAGHNNESSSDEEPVAIVCESERQCSQSPRSPQSRLRKQNEEGPLLGVIRLDYHYPPALGDIASPKSFNYRVIYRAVPGLSFEMCQLGKLTNQVREELLDAVDWLVEQGADGISGDCGFMMHFQSLIRERTHKSVFMSSLVQLSMLMCTLARDDEIAIFTADSHSLSPMKGLIRQECSVDTEDKHFVHVGCQDVPGFEAVANGDQVDVEKVKPGIVALAQKVLDNHPNVRYFVFECTEMPPYADAVRRATGIPVFDAISCCNFFMASFLDHGFFGARRHGQRRRPSIVKASGVA